MFFWKRLKNKKPKKRDLDRLSTSLETNVESLRSNLFTNDDTISYRSIRTRGPRPHECVLIYADNMAKRDFLTDFIVRPLMTSSLPKELDGHELLDFIMEQVIPADSVHTTSSYRKLADVVVRGVGVVLVEGCNVGLMVEAQGWEKRAVSEPQSEIVVRGPRQGFTEDLGVNISLVRRKLTTPKLKTKYMYVGLQTETKIALMYLESIASQDLVEEVTQRIERIEIDGVLESGYIEELIQDLPLSPSMYPDSKTRPDKVAAKLLEGRVAVLVDGTPFALTMPFLFVEVFQANEDYYRHWLLASFHRIIRYIAFLLTTSTPGLYLALVAHHPQLLPMNLAVSIAAARKNVPFPAMVEVVIMGLVFEILREGGVRLPRSVGQAISIVGAIVLGDAAVSASLVSAPMIIVVGLTGVAGFVVAQLNDVAVIVRLGLVVLGGVLGVYGFLIGIMGLVLHLASMKSFDVPYLSSLTSLSIQGSKDTLLRAPWWQMKRRPRNIASKNEERLQSQSRSKGR